MVWRLRHGWAACLVAAVAVLSLVAAACEDQRAETGATVELASPTGEQTQTPAVPGPAETGPTETGPTETGPTGPPYPARAWFKVDFPELGGGLPPEGAVPSRPEEGEVIAQINQGFPEARPSPNFLYVYADGRVITHGWGRSFVTERRLTPEGVELVRSGGIRVEDLVRSVSSDVRADAWEDPKIKPFVPSRYGVCYDQESGHPDHINAGYEYPSTVLGFFPAPARAILRGELTHGQVEGANEDPNRPECSGVTTDEARALVDILRDVRVRDSEGDGVIWELRLMLPHGVYVGHCVPGGCG